jgi:hypothetical protein
MDLGKNKLELNKLIINQIRNLVIIIQLEKVNLIWLCKQPEQHWIIADLYESYEHRLN